jgi:Tol biopolymer transport system component
MVIGAGTKLGPYEIEAPLGSGGMGDVYKATDTRLGRRVAIKVLKGPFTPRFEREARAISALNHPNICTLHDIGIHEGMPFLVMELVDGEPLTRRLNRSLTLDEALRVALDISAGLDAAHQQGIVHRDLKPGNIILTRAGAKLLDFGLAKNAEGPVFDGAATQTIEDPLTGLNVIVGTPKYMAPEQIQRAVVDARSDIFALGCVLWEMVTGQAAFAGNSTESVMAAVLRSEPAPVANPMLNWILQRSLAKDPAERWQTARDMRAAIQWFRESERTSRQSRTTPWLPWALAAASVLTAGLAIAFWRPQAATFDAELVRFAVSPPVGATFTPTWGSVSAAQFAISPNGRRLVFVASRAGDPGRLWVRPLDDTIARPLEGTEDASQPFWSTDSQTIAFFAEAKLKRVGAAGGVVEVLADAADPRGGSWGPDGSILFSSAGGVLHRWSAGKVAPLDEAGSAALIWWPQFLQDGRSFLYHRRTQAEHGHAVLVAGRLDSPERRDVLHSEWAAAHSTGHLLFVRDGTLMAQSFDADRLAVSGEPQVVTGDVAGTSSAYPAFSVSRNGVLAYSNVLTRPSYLTWFDRDGKELASIQGPGDYIDFQVSPDDKRVAISRSDPKNHTPAIWVVDVERNSSSRLNVDAGFHASVQWSPDGEHLFYRAIHSGLVEFYKKSSSGSGAEEMVYSASEQTAALGKPNNSTVPTQCIRDGRLIFHSSNPKTGWDIWTVDASGDRKASPAIQSRFNETHGVLSPDGDWIAYNSDESGQPEIYVSSFQNTNRSRQQVSRAGGTGARWRSDGKELYYLTPNHQLMAVPVSVGATFEAGIPKVLFATRISAAKSDFRSHYAVAANGRKFLVNTVADGTPVPIMVVSNWHALLRR